MTPLALTAQSAQFGSHSRVQTRYADRLEEVAWEYGRSSDSYLITEPNREHFWSRNQRGVVGFGRFGRYLIRGRWPDRTSV